jgi:hypothetical protein
MFDFDFEIEPDDFMLFGYPITIKVEYTATRAEDDHGKFGWDLNVSSIRIFCMGQRVDFDGKIYKKIESLAEESAKEHFENLNISKESA